MPNRTCSRIACPEPPVGTLTFDYTDSMAVLGPLSAMAEPHSFDLCERHAARTSAPRGWQLVRHRMMGDGPAEADSAD